MRLVQFFTQRDKSVKVGLQIGLDGDIIDLTKDLQVKNALEFIAGGQIILDAAEKWVS